MNTLPVLPFQQSLYQRWKFPFLHIQCVLAIFTLYVCPFIHGLLEISPGLVSGLLTNQCLLFRVKCPTSWSPLFSIKWQPITDCILNKMAARWLSWTRTLWMRNHRNSCVFSNLKLHSHFFFLFLFYLRPDSISEPVILAIMQSLTFQSNPFLHSSTTFLFIVSVKCVLYWQVFSLTSHCLRYRENTNNSYKSLN